MSINILQIKLINHATPTNKSDIRYSKDTSADGLFDNIKTCKSKIILKNVKSMFKKGTHLQYHILNKK